MATTQNINQDSFSRMQALEALQDNIRCEEDRIAVVVADLSYWISDARPSDLPLITRIMTIFHLLTDESLHEAFLDAYMDSIDMAIDEMVADQFHPQDALRFALKDFPWWAQRAYERDFDLTAYRE